MALLEDTFKGSNFWIGIGIAVAVPLILPALGAVARPLAKTAIKGYFAAVDALTPVAAGTTMRLGNVLTGARDQINSLVAEARQEHEAAVAGTAGDATAGASSATSPAGPITKPERTRKAKAGDTPS